MAEGSVDPTFAKELAIQRLIAQSPSLLPGVGDLPVAVAEEVRVPGVGRADVVVVDAEGAITIVECKRAANPEIRRWVIGQVFSYAAGLWKLDHKDLERGFVRATRGTRLTNTFENLPGWDQGRFREAVTQNLTEGAFRLIMGVDRITPELKRTVVFLNSHTPPELSVLALELERTATEEADVRVYGQRSEDFPPPEWPPDRWSLLEEIPSEDAARVADDLLDWAERKDHLVKTTYKQTKAAIRTPAGGLFRVNHSEVRVSLSALRAHWDEARIRHLIDELVKIDASFNIDMKRRGDRPTAPLESLSEKSKRDMFLDLMEENLAALTR